MKTNKFMRMASVMLVATLLSTCAISGTFAKYTTTQSAQDNARVAYWGFGADKDTTADLDLFDANYDGVAGATNVVAPGTSKEATLSLSYAENDTVKAPEVAYKYDVVAEATSTNGYAALDANPNFKWTLTVPGGNAQEFDTVAELVAAINATSQARIEAGNMPTGYVDGAASYTVGWNWVFETADTGMDAQDATDTEMGNDTTPDDVTIKITVTATQLDQ